MGEGTTRDEEGTSEDDERLMSYTRAWLDLVNQGGLFTVHDDIQFLPRAGTVHVCILCSEAVLTWEQCLHHVCILCSEAVLTWEQRLHQQ